ncbi:chlorophyll a/b-binding protein [Almyronema epifaneia]|uniref:Chlorophyll a/b-binding protein n=1 Tax=Almyronema epifaneia S1 TaxID=2991925 RepID=A0ABW6IHB5_9CYAN
MEEQQKFGFTQFAEVWNGRLAMLGFTIGIIVELVTGQGILSQIGLM